MAHKKSSTNRSGVSAAAGHYRAGRLTEAESLYRGVLKQQPDNLDALQGLAVLCHQRGHPEEALALFRYQYEMSPKKIYGRKRIFRSGDAGRNVGRHDL
jgi:Flp pilus assembly protein TadD